MSLVPSVGAPVRRPDPRPHRRRLSIARATPAESSISAYRLLSERVDIPLLVAETMPGVHMNMADFISTGCASAVRTSVGRGGVTGALRIAHVAESCLLRAEVHGWGLVNTHLLMSIPNTTDYEAFVGTNPAKRAPEVDASGLVHAPEGPGTFYEEQWQSDTPPNVRTPH